MSERETRRPIDIEDLTYTAVPEGEPCPDEEVADALARQLAGLLLQVMGEAPTGRKS